MSSAYFGTWFGLGVGLYFFCIPAGAHTLFSGLFNHPACVEELTLIASSNMEEYQSSAREISQDSLEQAEYIRRRVRVRYLLNQLNRSVEEWTYSNALLSSMDEMISTTGLPAFMLEIDSYGIVNVGKMWISGLEKRTMELVPILLETFNLWGVPTSRNQIDQLRSILSAKVGMAAFRAAVSRKYLNTGLAGEFRATFEDLEPLLLTAVRAPDWVSVVLPTYPPRLREAVRLCQDDPFEDGAPPKLVELLMRSAIPVSLKEEISIELDWQRKTYPRGPYFYPFLRAVRDYFRLEN